jgi:hypothetical protein
MGNMGRGGFFSFFFLWKKCYHHPGRHAGYRVVADNPPGRSRCTDPLQRRAWRQWHANGRLQRARGRKKKNRRFGKADGWMSRAFRMSGGRAWRPVACKPQVKQASKRWSAEGGMGGGGGTRCGHGAFSPCMGVAGRDGAGMMGQHGIRMSPHSSGHCLARAAAGESNIDFISLVRAAGTRVCLGNPTLRPG